METYKERQDVTGPIGNLLLVHSAFHSRKDFYKVYP
jgi:hypothetical protein